MRADKKLEKIVNWAEATRTSAARRGMLVEIKEGKIVVANREHTVVLISPINVTEHISFYSDEYPLGKYPEMHMENDNIIFSWEEYGQKRKVSYPAPKQSFFSELSQTLENQEKIEGIHQRYKTVEFSRLLEEIKFTTLETTESGLKMIQTDPRGIVSESEIKSEAGTTSKMEEW